MPTPLDISALTKTFDDLLARYEEWSSPRSKYMQEKMPRLNKDGYTWDEFVRGLDELEARMLKKYDPYSEVHAIMDELAPDYLAATPDERAQIRNLVSERRKLADLIRGYCDKMAAEIKSPHDVEKLRCGLAAISVEDKRLDYRDTLMSLARLFAAAEDAGIDPMPHFRDVAELSSKQTPKSGGEPVAELLRNFDRYAVLGPRRRGKGSRWLE